MFSKMSLHRSIKVIFIFYFSQLFSQNSFYVAVKGMSSSDINMPVKILRDEAILDAKLQAAERAGVDIKSITIIENFQLEFDKTISQTGAKIYTIETLDLGIYHDCYQVVLLCEVEPITDYVKTPLDYFTELLNDDNIFRKLNDRYYIIGDFQRTRQILYILIDKRDKYGDSRAQKAYYLLFYWGLYNNANIDYKHFVHSFPDSPYIDPSKTCIQSKYTLALIQNHRNSNHNDNALLRSITDNPENNNDQIDLSDMEKEKLINLFQNNTE